MLRISFEFRKGIFFIRLIGDLKKDSYVVKEEEVKNLILDNNFQYVVINTNYLKTIDLDGLNWIAKIYYMVIQSSGNLIICDKFKIIRKLLNSDVPSIDSELEVL